jgi:hypothetical protein
VFAAAERDWMLIQNLVLLGVGRARDDPTRRAAWRRS